MLSSTRSRCRSHPPWEPRPRTWRRPARPPVRWWRRRGRGAGRRRGHRGNSPALGIGHGPALVEDGVTGRTAEFVNGQVTDLLRLGSLREHHRHVSSSPHSPPHAPAERRSPGALKPGRAKAPECSVFHSAGHTSTGVLPGAGWARRGGRPLRPRSGAGAGAARIVTGARAGPLFGCAVGCGSRRASGRCPGWSARLRRRSRCGRPGSSRRARSNADACTSGRVVRWPSWCPR